MHITFLHLNQVDAVTLVQVMALLVHSMELQSEILLHTLAQLDTYCLGAAPGHVVSAEFGQAPYQHVLVSSTWLSCASKHRLS